MHEKDFCWGCLLWGAEGDGAEWQHTHCCQVPRKINAFMGILVLLQRWWWRHGRWWSDSIAFPHCLSLGIICGRSHLCDCTHQMAVPFRQLWGGVTQRRSKNITGPWSSQSLIWSEQWWVDCVCVALTTNTTHSSAPFPLVTHSLRQILFENRKVGDVGNDCLLSVNGTDFRVAKSYKIPYHSYKFKLSGLRYKVVLCIKASRPATFGMVQAWVAQNS
jgi:hypothetical protein